MIRCFQCLLLLALAWPMAIDCPAIAADAASQIPAFHPSSPAEEIAAWTRFCAVSETRAIANLLPYRFDRACAIEPYLSPEFQRQRECEEKAAEADPADILPEPARPSARTKAWTHFPTGQLARSPRDSYWLYFLGVQRRFSCF